MFYPKYTKHIKDWYQLYVMITIISLFFAIILGGIIGYKDYQQIQKEKSIIINDIEQVGSIIEQLLWIYDFDLIENIGESLLKREHIQSVNVTTATDFEVFNKSLPNYESYNLEKFSYAIYSKENKGVTVGTLDVVKTIKTNNEIVMEAFFESLNIFFIILFSSYMLIFTYINKFIAAPLEKLSKAIDSTVLSGEPVKTSFTDTTVFGRFASQFNEMQTKLEKQQKGLAKSLKQLTRQTSLANDQSILIDNVIKGVRQTVSYFDKNLNLVKSGIGDNRYSIFNHIPVFPHISADTLKKELLSKHHEVGIVKNSSDNILYELETLSPNNLALNIKALDLKESGLAIVSTDVTQARIIDKSLRQAQKLEAVGLLTSGVAHDLNNYLTIIRNSFSVLDVKNTFKGKGDKDISVMIDSGIETTQRASKVVQGLLAFSRNKPIENNLLFPTDVIDHLNTMISSSILGDKIDYKVKLETNTQFSADEDMLQTCLLNLIFNARDAIDGVGKISLIVKKQTKTQVKSVHIDDEIDYIVFEVHDTGEGISAEVADKILDPFFTTKRVGEGTGLGLSMVYGYAKQMNGILEFKNSSIGGAIFKLIIPVIDK